MNYRKGVTLRVSSLALAVILAIGAGPMAFAGRSTDYTYNELGQMTSIDGPRTDVADITYYHYEIATANLLSTTNAAGHTTAYSNYTRGGLAQTITTPNGAQIHLQYRFDGKVLQQDVVTEQGTQTTKYGYDVAVNLTSVQLPDGHSLTYVYDRGQRLIGIENDLGERIDYQLDSAGNITEQTVRNSSGSIVRQHQQVFDDLSRVRQVVGGTDGQTTERGYDADSRLTQITDAKNNPPTQNTYDSLNRLTRMVDSANGVTSLTYNAHGLIATVTDPRGLVTRYDYNGYGELAAINSPDTGITTFETDNNGNVTHRINARGTEVQFSYDALDRLTEQRYPADATKNILFEYDDTGTGPNGQTNYGLGQLTRITYYGGQIDYQFDQLGRLVAEQRSIGGQSYLTEYRFNTVGQLSELVYPSGRILHYSYGSQGRLNRLTTQEHNTAPDQILVDNLDYLPFGPVTGFDYGNGITQSYTFDLDYRLTGLTSQVQDWVYRYDLNSNIEQILDSQDSTHDQVYQYDALNRLIAADGPYGDYRYQYDPVGNRTERQKTWLETTELEAYQYAAEANQLNQVDSTETNNGNTTQTDSRLFTYSETGQLLLDINNDRTLDLHYDENDRLAQADVYGATLKTTTYQYNPLGQRIVQSQNGKTQHIHYNAQGQRISESDANGDLIREYLYLGNQPIAMVVANAGTDANQASTPVEPWILDSEAANTLITGVWRVSSHYPDYQGTGYRYSLANQSITSRNTIDTDQATLVGTWHTSTATPGYIGPNYRYAAKGDGTTSATWPVAANGNKDLWVIYTSGSNRASNATYTVHHANGQTNVTVDQSQNGGTWALLGNFNLDANSKVVLTNLANSYVIADGIRIGDDSNNPEYASVTWPITVPQTGRYKVYGTWNSGSSRASNAKYTINAGPNQHTSIQNQRLNGGQWNLLGEYTFDIADNPNGQNNVSLSSEANGYLIADAIKLELIEDNQPTPSGLFFIHNDHLGTPKRFTDTQGQVVWSLQTTPFGEVHEEIANGITLLNGFPG